MVRKTNFKVGDSVTYKGLPGLLINRWGGLLGCPECTELVSTDEVRTPCCNRKPIVAHCEDVFDILVKGKGVVSCHVNNFEPVEKPAVDLQALKRSMDNAAAEFRRIPDECDLDPAECERRRLRMVKTKSEYYAAKRAIA